MVFEDCRPLVFASFTACWSIATFPFLKMISLKVSGRSGAVVTLSLGKVAGSYPNLARVEFENHYTQAKEEHSTSFLARVDSGDHYMKVRKV